MFREKVEAALREVQDRIQYNVELNVPRLLDKQNLQFYSIWVHCLSREVERFQLLYGWLTVGCQDPLCNSKIGEGDHFCPLCERIYQILDDLDDPGEEPASCDPNDLYEKS